MTLSDLRPDQLIQEIEACRKQILKLDKDRILLADVQREKAKIEHSLRERVKELSCLYGISELIRKAGHSIENLLQGAVNLLPVSWQYPEITCARITFGETVFTTSLFSTSRWQQRAPLTESENIMGAVEIYYLKEMPEEHEGPFLREERLLIDAVAETISKAIEQIHGAEQHEAERAALTETNRLLKERLEQQEKQFKQFKVTLQSNVDTLLVPIIRSLKSEVQNDQKGQLQILEKDLTEISSPFMSTLNSPEYPLTAVELQICHLIAKGLSTHQIADLRSVSTATVRRQREKIRHKLGLTNKKINLRTYLQSRRNS